jgi:hypothetical protein
LNVVNAIRHKVPMPLKLKLIVSLGRSQSRLDDSLHHFQAVGIQVLQKILAARFGAHLKRATQI